MHIIAFVQGRLVTGPALQSEKFRLACNYVRAASSLHSLAYVAFHLIWNVPLQLATCDLWPPLNGWAVWHGILSFGWTADCDHDGLGEHVSIWGFRCWACLLCTQLAVQGHQPQLVDSRVMIEINAARIDKLLFTQGTDAAADVAAPSGAARQQHRVAPDRQETKLPREPLCSLAQIWWSQVAPGIPLDYNNDMVRFHYCPCPWCSNRNTIM